MALINKSISKSFIFRLSAIILASNIILSINNSFVYGKNFGRHEAGKIFAAGVVVGSIRHCDRGALLVETPGEESSSATADKKKDKQDEVGKEIKAGDTHQESSLLPQKHMVNHQSIRQEKFQKNRNEIQEFLDENWRDWEENWRDYYTGLAVSVNIGSAVDTLSSQHVLLKISDQDYYYSSGVFYVSSGGTYVAVPPPYGAVVGTIQTNYTVVQKGDEEYLDSGGVFYLRVNGGYQVALPPTGATVNKLPVYARSTLIDSELYYVYGDAFYQPAFRSGAVVYTIVKNPSVVFRPSAENRLKKLERQAIVSRKKDLDEIARKEDELAVLDQEINDIKNRLKTHNANTDDSLDTMLAMANEKENLVNLLEELRSKREAEERKEEVEMEELKTKQEKNEQESISLDTRKEIIHKYEKIVSLKYGKDMEETAWSSLINSFPKAKGLAIGDIERLKQIYGIPLVKLHSSYKDLTMSNVQTIENIYIRSKHDWGFYAYSTISHNYEPKSTNGNNLVIDNVTGLMWHQSGSDSYMEWNKTKQWLKDLNSGGYAGYYDWRLPSLAEAVSLLESDRKNEALYIDTVFSNKQKRIWTGNKLTGSKSAWLVDFQVGTMRGLYTNEKCYVRPVRPRKYTDW
ncbi:MAG: DUF1566 domain-containing protein [Candidatus Brocadiaceae bacterium]|nr:DUF1566 domain-containing protein [Candidatus Brocadiaceae bacterium]